MAARCVDRHRLVDGARAALHLAGLRLAAAQEVERVGGLRPLGAEAVHHVEHRRVAVAQRAVGVLRTTRQLDRRGQQHRVERLHVAVAGSESQLGGGGVGRRTGKKVVVDLHDDPAAGPQLHAEAGLAHGLLAAGRPGADPRGVVDVLEPVEAGAAEAGPALAVLLGVLGLGRVDLLGRDLEEDDVVDDVGVAGLHGRAGQPLVLGELGVEQEAAVVVGPGAVRRGRRVRRRHGQRRAALALCGAGPPWPAWHWRDRRGRTRPASAVLLGGLRRRRRPVVARRSVPAQEASRSVAAAASAIRPRVARSHACVQPRRSGADRTAFATSTTAQPGRPCDGRPPSTWRWAWNTVWPAPAPVLKTNR